MKVLLSGSLQSILLLLNIIALIGHLLLAEAVSATPLPAKKIASSLGDTASVYCAFVPERKDDFAWENDLIAFRAYGPALRSATENSGIDCWLKRVKYPIIKKWYALAQTGISYHQDHGEGLDNYHVGASAGCGGTALWMNGRQEALETFVNWKILNRSKTRSEFVLYYEKKIGPDIYREEKHIVIKTGQRLFQGRSTFSKNGQPLKNSPVSVGLTTHNGLAKSFRNLKSGCISCWEKIDHSGLGTAVIIQRGNIQKIIEITDKEPDRSHILIIAKTDDNAEIVYYAGYGWEKAGEIKTAQEWRSYLRNFIEGGMIY